MDHPDKIKQIGVVGAGTMGRGIAQVAAQSGYEVILYDVAETVIEDALKQVIGFINRAAEKGRSTKDEAKSAIARIKTTMSLADFSPVDFVIEAAPERLNLKKDIFTELTTHTRDDVILASNTSTLSITQIAAATDRPTQVVGMHFFNPPPLMPLVEVIGGADTEESVIAVTMELAHRMGKSPVQAKDTPGFIVNRVARPFYLESLRMLEEGVADHATIDRLLKEGGGFRMGPFELMDLVGLDINYAVTQIVYNAFFHEPRFRPNRLQTQMVDAKRLGRKTGRGWYEYGGNS